MGDIGNAIKNLYDKFLLRDLLSFIIPGAIVVLAALLLFLPEQSLWQRLEALFEYSRDMHWLLYIPLFGVFYLVGFAVQCLGELFGVISSSPPDEYPWQLKQRWNILNIGNRWTKDKDKIWWNEYYEKIEEFFEVTKSDEDAVQRRERLIVLKQMCGNGLLSIFIAGIFLGISFCSLSWVKILVPSLVTFSLFISLLWGHRVHVLRQYAREKIIVSSRKKETGS